MSKFSVVFTGQGSQKPGMASDFIEKFSDSKALFDTASSKLGFDLLEICSSEDGRLDRTEYSQPALLAAEMAIYIQAKNKFSQTPTAYAGHSLGEYVALTAAGVIPFEDAILIVRKRGQLMQNALPDGQGGMLAIVDDNLSSTNYQEIVKAAGAEVANFNTPAQVVISGSVSSIEASSAELAKQYPSMRLVRLNVGTPFHSSLMKGIEPEFRDYLNQFAPKFNLGAVGNVLSNFTGTYHTADALIDNLVQQISGSVRWVENMNVLKSTESEVIEFGPSRVLSKMCSAVGITAKSIYDLRSFEKSFAS